MNLYMIKKVIFFILLGFFATVINSCTAPECACKFDDFKVVVLDLTNSQSLNIGDVINEVSLGLRVDMKSTVVEKNGYSKYDCDKSYFTNPIISVTIKTIFDYSGDFPANSDITSLFKASIPIGYRDPTIDLRLGKVETKIYDIDKVVTILAENIGTHRLLSIFDLYLMDDTSVGQQQMFEITIVLSDETILVKKIDGLLL